MAWYELFAFGFTTPGVVSLGLVLIGGLGDGRAVVVEVVTDLMLVVEGIDLGRGRIGNCVADCGLGGDGTAGVCVRAAFAGGPAEDTCSAFRLSGGAGLGAVERILSGATPLGVGFVAGGCVLGGGAVLAFPIEDKIELRNCIVMSDWPDSYYHAETPTLIALDALEFLSGYLLILLQAHSGAMNDTNQKNDEAEKQSKRATVKSLV